MEELLAALQEDHEYVCDQAGVGYDAETNSGEAKRLIEALDEENTRLKADLNEAYEERDRAQEELDKADAELTAANQECDAAEARALEVEEAMINALLRLRLGQVEDAILILDQHKCAPVFESAEACRKRYEEAMQRSVESKAKRMANPVENPNSERAN